MPYPPAACTKDTYGRGAGTIPDSCPSGQEKQGLLCYPKCPTDWTYGWVGVTPQHSLAATLRMLRHFICKLPSTCHVFDKGNRTLAWTMLLDVA